METKSKNQQSGFGITGMILGILAVLSSVIFLGGALGITAVAFSIIGLTQKNRSHGTAIAGLVLGIVAMSIVTGNLIGNGLVQSIIESNPQTEDKTDSSTMHNTDRDEKSEENKNNSNALFNHMEVYNGNDCIISVVNGDKKEINFEIQNNSGKDYIFNVRALSINGIMTKCSTTTERTSVPANKKAKIKIKFVSDWLKDIENIEYIDILFLVENSKTNIKEFETEITRIKTNLFNGEKIFECEAFYRFDGIKVAKNSIGKKYLSYLVINENNYLVETSLKNCSLNGWAFEPGYSTNFESDGISLTLDGYEIIVFPNSMVNVDVDISEFMEENNIDNVENFEFSLDIVPDDDYMRKTETEKIIFENE